MKTFYSHSEKDENEQTFGSKKLIVHTEGVRTKAIKSYCQNLGFSEHLETKKLLNNICIYHDLGKYSAFFQDYLLGKEGIDPKLKQHAKFGGFALFQKYFKLKDEFSAIIAAYLIIHHHKSLTDITELKRFIGTDGLIHEKDCFLQQAATITDHLPQIADEIDESQLADYIQYPDKRNFNLALIGLSKKPTIENYFLINYLFSLLIEADKLDASKTIMYDKVPLPALLVENRIGEVNFQSYSSNELKSLTQNQLRAYVRGVVIKHLENDDILNQRLFTLTAPTGIGKTLTALDFALRLKDKIRLKEGYEAQIIYALPFINIIEQAIKEYDKVFKGNGRVLAHYQFADVFEQLTKSNVLTPDENEQYNQQTMLLDTWQSDVVITTFVQFLQTLIGNRNKLLKKFNHLAGAIVILDEVQTIRLDHLPLVGAAIHYLSKFLNTRVILMTATKPKTFDLANREIIAEQKGDEKAQPLELLADFESVFAAFKRTKIVPLISEIVADEQQFIQNHFKVRWKPRQSCLIVCNLVKRSVDVFEAVKKYIEETAYKNPVYYLSTNIISATRLQVIQDVKSDLLAGLKPILISTQAIEAGVDLDFDMGFRDIGPIDSIIQVAGRINRENSPERWNSPLYIIDFDDCTKIYERLTTIQARKALEFGIKKFGDDIREEHFLELIETYYESLSAEDAKSFSEARKFFDSMKRLNYDNEDKSTFPVSKFQVIEQRGGIASVYIEIDENAKKTKDAFLAMIHKKLSKEIFDKDFKLSFNQHIISVPEYLPKVKELKLDKVNLLCDGLYIVRKNEISDYYDLITGFDRRKEELNNANAVML
ncbi:CRISPR-associated helicase Cas3' [Runella sp. SP2]|uniref:CRISPR-associated helicase Cas3' n=1 Tax=Runella sp. SP2 TaxID=2268026 RepID=UPI000F08E99E|nr:CRISPR-associated helicase Cas3' [Runella sp. SP2]AYQ36654.1 CRISPR-associated helicase Cas3' [Runella sp. SP2]